MRSVLLIPLLVVTGCAPAAPIAAGGGDAWQRDLAGRVAGPPQPCISTLANQNARVVDSATVAYELGRTVWVNRLRGSCPSLSPYNTLIVERSGSEICRGDRVRGVEPGASIPGPYCNLQDWVPYRRS